MNNVRAIPNPQPVPSEELARRVTVGEQIATLSETEGYEELLRLVEYNARRIQKNLMQGAGKQEGAFYAKELGVMKGLTELPRIVERAIKDGRDAEQELRAKEVRALDG